MRHPAHTVCLLVRSCALGASHRTSCSRYRCSAARATGGDASLRRRAPSVAGTVPWKRPRACASGSRRGRRTARRWRSRARATSRPISRRGMSCSGWSRCRTSALRGRGMTSTRILRSRCARCVCVCVSVCVCVFVCVRARGTGGGLRAIAFSFGPRQCVHAWNSGHVVFADRAFVWMRLRVRILIGARRACLRFCMMFSYFFE
jgi:hypothetical protein